MNMRLHALAPTICVVATAAAGPVSSAGGTSLAPLPPGGLGVSAGFSTHQAAVGNAPANRKLPDAAQRRDIETVRVLIDEGVDVDAPQADGATALAWAVHWDDLATADLLLGAGADVNAANDLGVTPLMLASLNGSVPMVDLLLRAGADPNAARPAGGTALMMAARSGDATVLRRLIAAGADLDAATSSGPYRPDVGRCGAAHTRRDSPGGGRSGREQARTAVYTPRARRIVREARVLSRFEAVNPAGAAPRRGSGPAAARGRVHAAALRDSGG